MPKTKRSKTTRLQFTERRISSLATPGAATTLYDEQVRELGLKLLPSGRRVFFWFRSVPEEEQPDRAGKPTWKTIGEWPAITLDSARAKAKDYDTVLFNWRRDGCKRPSPFKVQRSELTLSGLAEEYIARHLRGHAHHPEEAEREVRYGLGKHLAPWRDRNLSNINSTDVLDLHLKLGKTRYAANGVIELLSRLYNFAIKQGLYTGANPARNIERYHEEKRTRFVQPDEMPKLFAALKTEKNKDLIDFVTLALWTGARKLDVLSMRWQDLQLDDNRWNVPDPKNRTPYQIALTPEAVAILKRRANDSPWVFPGKSKTGHIIDLKIGWRKLLARAGIKNLRQHDLRRTLGSWQAGQGTSLLIIGKSLGHRSLAATQIYSQVNLDPVRESVGAATRAMIAASRKKPKQLLAGG